VELVLALELVVMERWFIAGEGGGGAREMVVWQRHERERRVVNVGGKRDGRS